MKRNSKDWSFKPLMVGCCKCNKFVLPKEALERRRGKMKRIWEWCGGLFFLWALLTLENCYSIMQIRSACALKLPRRIFYMCYYHRFGWFSHIIFEHQYIGNSFVRTLLARLLIWKWSLNCYKHHWLLLCMLYYN